MGGLNGQDVARRALEQAAQKLGGMDALALRLGMTSGALRVYLMSSEPVPQQLFLRVVDILQPATPPRGK